MIRNYSSNASDYTRLIGMRVRKPNMFMLGIVESVEAETQGLTDYCYLVLEDGERINVCKIGNTQHGEVALRSY
jgi:hypothetical protein